MSKIPHRKACFVDSRAHFGARAIEKVVPQFRRYILRVRCGFEQSGDADATLDERVVHFARKAIAFFEHSGKLATDVAHVEPVRSEACAGYHHAAQSDEPSRLVQIRLQMNG